MRRFAKVIVRVFGTEYLRAPNEDGTKKLMATNERRGWPGMLGSIDCMHIGHGKIALRHGEECIVASLVMQQLC